MEKKMLEDIWLKVEEQLVSSMPASKTMWLDYVSFREADGDVVHLECNSAMTKDSFERNCMTEALNLMQELTGRPITLDVSVMTDESTLSQTGGQDGDEDHQRKESSKKGTRTSLLNPAYTFDSFIPCDSTSFAYNACKAIAMDPGANYKALDLARPTFSSRSATTSRLRIPG